LTHLSLQFFWLFFCVWSSKRFGGIIELRLHLATPLFFFGLDANQTLLLTISYTGQPATDLGYLLYKSPFRGHSVQQVFGKTHVFYPEIALERCTVALSLDIEPLRRVHECVFGVLALESEPVDPRH